MCNILHHPPSPSPSLRRRHSLLEAGAHPLCLLFGPSFLLWFWLSFCSRTYTHLTQPHAHAHAHAHERAPHARIYIPRPLSNQSMSMCTSTSALIHSSACCLLCPIYPFLLLDFPLWTPLFCSVLFSSCYSLL
ncbi:hypothetical protein DFH08DRAFT_832445 [Mycena albidolilacea]|uniref:Uncharacterized protein n=1 Tax=Mycena albidolilacea TaxID=1033008 RepID=A0AAD7AVN8_9AGAR|nr:hypothetical protein DFH08DRAFT_832445 [Mycena albidolilacea]